MTFEPTPEQQAVIDAPTGPLRVSAGAGTGKTTTIALRVASMVTNGGVAPEEVLGVTFTNKAAGELSDRIRFHLASRVEAGQEVEVRTYHGFAAQIVREFGVLIGIERGTKVISPTYSRQLLLEVMRRHRLPGVDQTYFQVVGRMLRLSSSLGDHLLTAREVAAPEGAGGAWVERAGLLEGLRHYELEKRRLGVADYGDLITGAHRVLIERPETAARISARYRVVLLDEYQDTNPAQRKMLQALFPSGHSVTAVGDTDQTIYEWRGASLDNFRSFPLHFPSASGHPAPTLPLTFNRRSGTRIIEVANAIRDQIGSDSAPLQPKPDAPEGGVETAWWRTSVDEAEWIATRLEELHESMRWRDAAVLFRKNKDIPLILETLGRHEIPVEVANLGGLLSVPEVTDLHCWLRILADPEDGPALARVMLGSGYRLGLADLAALARWVRSLRPRRPERDDEAGPSPIEAVDRLEDVAGLRPEAAPVLQSFRATYRALLVAAQGSSLVELCRTVLEATRAWSHVDALPSASRLSARLNLYRFLDLAEDWSPLEGRPSLDAFLLFLADSADAEADELDPARLSGADAVTLVTVHRAKGLEWEAVFLPAVHKDNFPSRQINSDNPRKNAQSLPYELRLDAGDLPGPEMTDAKFEAAVRERHLQQEWRVAYVAATRAKSLLAVSGAFWGGSPEPNTNPREPSPLFELVDSHPMSRQVNFEPDPGEQPELLGLEPTAPSPDPTFASGWEEAMRRAIADPAYPAQLADELKVSDAFERRLADEEATLFDLPQLPGEEASATPIVSVTGLVTYASCPLRYRWSEVDRLPQRRSPAARRGSEVHRRIELHNLGVVPLDDLAFDTYDATSDVTTAAGQDERPHDPMVSFLGSRFSTDRPLLTEAPFELRLNSGTKVRGRIDAVYESSEGIWEVVDFKTGPPSADPATRVQLQAYAVAVEDVPFRSNPPDDVTVTFAHLGKEAIELSEHVDEAWLQEAREHLDQLTAGIEAQAYPATPGPGCASCDFFGFCAAGQAYLS
ncbi:MAG TPA: ATP-dependent DNA helicase [Acidimicrobiia bacterium]